MEQRKAQWFGRLTRLCITLCRDKKAARGK
jgi:hypothetical protein